MDEIGVVDDNFLHQVEYPFCEPFVEIQHMRQPGDLEGNLVYGSFEESVNAVGFLRALSGRFMTQSG
jgi:hypothetical protein